MHSNTAAGYEGFGFIKKSESQPEVINPKTQKPYDLTDPEYPVVNDASHKFKWQYWKMPKSVDSLMIDYLEERWVYFNRTRFGGRLTKPQIRLLRDVNALKMKLRGLWTSSDTKPPGELAISPNLFNAPHEGWVNRTLIHEMCHQEEFETFGTIDRTEKGHGPRWQALMRRAGLRPNRFDTEGNETYADQKEKKIFKEIEEKSRPFREAYAMRVATRTPFTKPVVGAKVLFATARGIILAELTNKSTARPLFWNASELGANGSIVELWHAKKTAFFTPTYNDLRHNRYEA